MAIKNTFLTKTESERLAKQAELHRKCLLLLQTAVSGGCER